MHLAGLKRREADHAARVAYRAKMSAAEQRKQDLDARAAEEKQNANLEIDAETEDLADRENPLGFLVGFPLKKGIQYCKH